MIIWALASVVSNKFVLAGKTRLRDFTKPVWVSDGIMLAAVTFFIAVTQIFSYSRMIVFGTIVLSFFAELFLVALFYYYYVLNRNSDNSELVESYIRKLNKNASRLNISSLSGTSEDDTISPLTLLDHQGHIMQEASIEVYDFIHSHLGNLRDNTIVLGLTRHAEVDELPALTFYILVNLKPTNDVKRVNKFFESVNARLPLGGLFSGCIHTNEIRKKKMMRAFPPGINLIIYTINFLFHRVLPKTPYLNRFYFFMTNGFERHISKAEAFGRLYSCGFEIVDELESGKYLYWIARKVGEPAFDDNPTYGPLISLKRIGKNGKIVHVLKLRTMHPYAEYLQAYVHELNQLEEGGKFKNDFRISTAGKIFRKLWLDELPMLFNLFKGDLKLVGVRPLSKHYFNLYTRELQEKRIRFRPGLIPPFYADMPKTLHEIMQSELNYLSAYEQHPFLTDWKYFWKAFYNIVFKHARSK